MIFPHLVHYKDYVSGMRQMLTWQSCGVAWAVSAFETQSLVQESAV